MQRAQRGVTFRTERFGFSNTAFMLKAQFSHFNHANMTIRKTLSTAQVFPDLGVCVCVCYSSHGQIFKSATDPEFPFFIYLRSCCSHLFVSVGIIAHLVFHIEKLVCYNTEQ